MTTTNKASVVKGTRYRQCKRRKRYQVRGIDKASVVKGTRYRQGKRRKKVRGIPPHFPLVVVDGLAVDALLLLHGDRPHPQPRRAVRQAVHHGV